MAKMGLTGSGYVWLGILFASIAAAFGRSESFGGPIEPGPVDEMLGGVGPGVDSGADGAALGFAMLSGVCFVLHYLKWQKLH